ncbi:putative Major intrinsic protein-domain-containing protein [Seiridium cardinale]|uniref:Major intrinsic protein-domain-containing protein n=1 Tax=Seiridium cardinale TaxID=138064 RepID=A0ABR2XZE7_9PEZI
MSQHGDLGPKFAIAEISPRSRDAFETFKSHAGLRSFTPTVVLFAGRISGNQALVVDPDDPANESLLRKRRDAAPYLSLSGVFNWAGFADVQLWKYATVECIGTAMIVFSTSWSSLHPTTASSGTNNTELGPAGIYSTSAFIGPLVGGISNWFLLTLFIYSFSSVSGARLNPTITFATFMAGITSLPRLVLYLAGQTLSGMVAGFILRAPFGTRDFAAGGCLVDTSIAPTSDAFLLEFMYSLTLIFLSFGVGLDPRQAAAIGPTLAPWLVGMVLDVLSFGSSFTRNGYCGACRS